MNDRAKEFHPSVKQVFPVTAADGREYLDVVTDFKVGQDGPDPTLVAEIKRWAASYRPGRNLRYDWEARR